MDFNDIFRSFFRSYGPSGTERMEDDMDDTEFFNAPPSLGFYGNRNDDAEQDGSTFGRGHGGRFPSSGGDLFFKFEEDTQDLFRHFEEMFKNFGLAEFPPSAFSRIDQAPPPPPQSSIHQTPRDSMLKHPDRDQPSAALPQPADKERLQRQPERSPMRETPSWFSLWDNKPKRHWPMPSLPSAVPHREDQDLDDQVKGRKLDDLLTRREPSSSPNTNPGHSSSPATRSYFRSISVQTIRKPDGTVEQRRTETDADGNVTSTVTCTNPKDPGTSSPLLPNQRRPSNEDQARLRRDETALGQAETNSIFEKLFGSSGHSKDKHRWGFWNK